MIQETNWFIQNVVGKLKKLGTEGWKQTKHNYIIFYQHYVNTKGWTGIKNTMLKCLNVHRLKATFISGACCRNTHWVLWGKFWQEGVPETELIILCTVPLLESQSFIP